MIGLLLHRHRRQRQDIQLIQNFGDVVDIRVGTFVQPYAHCDVLQHVHSRKGHGKIRQEHEPPPQAELATMENLLVVVDRSLAGRNDAREAIQQGSLPCSIRAEHPATCPGSSSKETSSNAHMLPNFFETFSMRMFIALPSLSLLCAAFVIYKAVAFGDLRSYTIRHARERRLLVMR